MSFSAAVFTFGGAITSASHALEEHLGLLYKKLELATFPDELKDAGRKYGVPLADIKRLVARWKDGFDWRVQEAALNAELPQFTRDISVDNFESLNIHYVHQKSSLVDAIPLLFVHGWPGTFIEVRKILPLLLEVSPDHPSFHVVALGLPGYGFSQAPTKQGFSFAQYAEVAQKLMLALGYNEYVTQGGDWGNLITRKIALDYGGKHSKAWYSNYPVGVRPSALWNPSLFIKHLLTPYSASDKVIMERGAWFQRSGKGYYEEQSTQPQTLDSPLGLLAWIYEKLVLWTENYPWEDDEVLTWVSLYHFSRAGPAASVRIYFEVQPDAKQMYALTPSIPMGISLFPKDLKGFPATWYHTNGNLVYHEEHEEGGHFAAHEKPDLLVGDLRVIFGKSGPASGVVAGETGY